MEVGRETCCWSGCEVNSLALVNTTRKGYLHLEPIISLRLGDRSKHFIFDWILMCMFRRPTNICCSQSSCCGHPLMGRVCGPDQVVWSSGGSCYSARRLLMGRGGESGCYTEKTEEFPHNKCVGEVEEVEEQNTIKYTEE